MPSPTTLVVDDEDLIRWSLKEQLEASGHRVLEAANGKEAGRQVQEGVDLVLLDYRLPDIDGFALLERIKRSHPETPVIMMTAYSTIESAVEAIKQGAYHYVHKPFEMDEMLHLVGQALETRHLRQELKELRAQRSELFSFDQILGQSPPMQKAKALLRKTAASRASTVLLMGESGTGKDLAARAIHYNGERAAQPFMHITCSAVPESLLESDLFGHERGAFTDARQQKKGLFEMADRGTVYLDEISEMAPQLQAKLLRVLEEKTFKRVGGTQDIRVDVRLIAATNRNIEEAVSRGQFRADLYYRLNVLTVTLPPLRERPSDVPLLAAQFVDGFAREFRRPPQSITPEAMALLERYPWPGNVRELRNAMERAVLLSESSPLGPDDFETLSGQRRPTKNLRLPAGGIDLEALERDLVVQALGRADWNQTRAARLLGMNRDQIRYRIEKFGLRHEKAASGRPDHT